MEVVQGKILRTQTRGDQGMDCWVEGASMTCTWLIIAEVRGDCLGVKTIPEQGDEHHNISLLHNLGMLDSVVAEHRVHRRSPIAILRQVHLFQLEETSELFDESRPGIGNGH